MFRPNFLLTKCRLSPQLYGQFRSFCSSDLKEKCYIIKTKDKGKTVLTDSQIMKRFHDNQIMQQKHLGVKKSSWESLIEYLKHGQREAIILIHKHKIDDKLAHFKKNQTNKLQAQILIMKEKMEPEKLKLIPPKVKQQLTALQETELYMKLMELPKTLVVYSKVGLAKGQHYFGIFLESETRKKLEQIWIWTWIHGKFVVLRVLRFIREAYFDKSGVKAIQHKKH